MTVRAEFKYFVRRYFSPELFYINCFTSYRILALFPNTSIIDREQSVVNKPKPNVVHNYLCSILNIHPVPIKS